MFNVLFVIGMCAVFSKEILVLTWWPLARDSSYYILSLGLLALFFGGPTASSAYMIEFWEAFILFLAYVGYVLVMSKNVQLQKFVSRLCSKSKKVVQPNESYMENGEAGAAHDDKATNEKGEILPSNPLIRPTKFRAGVLQMILNDQDEVEQLRVKVVAQIVGDVSECFHTDSPHLLFFEIEYICLTHYILTSHTIVIQQNDRYMQRFKQSIRMDLRPLTKMNSGNSYVSLLGVEWLLTRLKRQQMTCSHQLILIMTPKCLSVNSSIGT